MRESIGAIYNLMGDARPFPYIEGGVCFFASHNHKYVGLVYLKPISNREAEIIYVGVAPACRRLGLAHQLIGDLQKQYNKLYLEVEVTNLPACALYDRLGFRVQRTRHHYYGPGRDAFDMVWSA